MRQYITGAIVGLVVFAAIKVIAAPDARSNDPGLDYVRAPIPMAQHTTQLTISGTSAGTAQLVQEKVYSMICNTAVQYETGDAGAATADTNSNYLPADTMFYWSTGRGDVSRYMSAVQVASAGTCYIHEQR
jgi:hypothetical protein